MKYVAEIVPSADKGWDVEKAVRIYFNSKRRLLYFARYYSFAHDVLIRIYWGTWWCASYTRGHEIWNDF